MYHQVRQVVGTGDMTWRQFTEFYVVVIGLIVIVAPAAMFQRVVDFFSRR